MLIAAANASALDDPCLDGSALQLAGSLKIDHLEISASEDQTVLRLLGLVENPETTRALSEAIEGQETLAAIVPSGQKADKFGRMPVFVSSEARGISLQASLLQLGLARLHHRDLSSDCYSYLFQQEDQAIRQRLGLWSDPHTDMLSTARPAMMAPRFDTFQVVEGRIVSTGRTRRVFYLNFGEYWREDFTVEIRGRAEEALKRAGKSPEDWVGRRVRVRGYLSESRGPMIALDSPQQIELLAD